MTEWGIILAKRWVHTATYRSTHDSNKVQKWSDTAKEKNFNLDCNYFYRFRIKLIKLTLKNEQKKTTKFVKKRGKITVMK